MAVMSNVPVFYCRRCGRAVYATHLSTTIPDPSTELLEEFMRNLSKIALCEFHINQYNYYAAQGKGQEWLEGKVF